MSFNLCFLVNLWNICSQYSFERFSMYHCRKLSYLEIVWSKGRWLLKEIMVYYMKTCKLIHRHVDIGDHGSSSVIHWGESKTQWVEVCILGLTMVGQCVDNSKGSVFFTVILYLANVQLLKFLNNRFCLCNYSKCFELSRNS